MKSFRSDSSINRLWYIFSIIAIWLALLWIRIIILSDLEVFGIINCSVSAIVYLNSANFFVSCGSPIMYIFCTYSRTTYTYYLYIFFLTWSNLGSDPNLFPECLRRYTGTTCYQCSGSWSLCFGPPDPWFFFCGSGSFHQQAKQWIKTLTSAV